MSKYVPVLYDRRHTKPSNPILYSKFSCCLCGEVFSAYNSSKRKFCSMRCRNLNQKKKFVEGNPSSLKFVYSFKGKHHSEQRKREVAEESKLRWQQEEYRCVIGNKISIGLNKIIAEGKRRTARYWLGKKKPQWLREKSARRKEAHWNWQNGKSFELYGDEFIEELKEQIRERDRRLCCCCGKNETENRGRLHVHHIDYNKRNNSKCNLISLCPHCHAHTNHSKTVWLKDFEEAIDLYYQQDYFLEQMSPEEQWGFFKWVAT